MAGNVDDDNDDDHVPTQRDSHFNNQRSSVRSSTLSNTSAGPPPRSRPNSDWRRLNDFELDLKKPEHADSDSIPSLETASSPAPNVPYTRQRERAGSSVRRKDRSTGKRTSQSTVDSRAAEARKGGDVLTPDSWLHLYNENAQSPNLPPPLRTPRTRGQTGEQNASRTASQAQRSRRPSFPLGRTTPGGISGSQLDITALPSISPVEEDDVKEQYVRSKRTPQAQRTSRIATELYTISYLIFFSIWGTLARLGLQALTFYPGAPVTFSELWANVAGTFIVGLLAEDCRLFAAEWGNGNAIDPEPSADSDTAHHQRRKARHGKIKKTIPLYIGLATGFCGSFTSFSSFIRDIFLSLSNDLPSPINHPYPFSTNSPLPPTTTTLPRNSGYSVLAVLATTILTLATCSSALKIGTHLALSLHPLTPTLPFRLTRRILDPLFVLLATATWLAAILLSIFPPHNAWRGQALYACVFAPVGCLLRYYLSLALNSIVPSFPLGTFTVNVFGTAVLGMAYDLQHVELGQTGLVGGSVVACQVLQGVMDGFCGALTTVSTWIAELEGLMKRGGRKGRRAAYGYAGGSVVGGVCVLVVVMGSVRWTVGWSEVLCMS